MEHETFHLSKQGHIATVTLDRPPVNAVNEASRYELIDIFDTVSEDPDVRVVIFTGQGKYFCGGADIKERSRVRDPKKYREVNRMSLASITSVKDCRKPVIGAVNGPAIGAGTALMLNCDILVASEDAYFWMPEIDRGMVGGATTLSRAFTPWRARWALLTSGKISAADLYRLDVVQEVVPKDQVMAAATRLAEVIVAKQIGRASCRERV
jgi:enoyl-CoA hydratase